jgi:hypothetical protein
MKQITRETSYTQQELHRAHRQAQEEAHNRQQREASSKGIYFKEMVTAMLARLSGGGIVINIHNTKTIIMFLRKKLQHQPKRLVLGGALTASLQR